MDEEEDGERHAGLRSIACKILSAATSTGRAGVETASILATLFAVDAAWTVLAPQRPNKTATGSIPALARYPAPAPFLIRLDCRPHLVVCEGLWLCCALAGSSVRRHAAVDHKLAAGHPRSFV
jgi:hypothetical protein